MAELTVICNFVIGSIIHLYFNFNLSEAKEEEGKLKVALI